MAKDSPDDLRVLDAIAWLLLPLGMLLVAPSLVTLSLTSLELLNGFGIFDPATGGDPALVQALPALRRWTFIGLGVAGIGVLWTGARVFLQRRVIRWWGGALLLASGVLLATPFVLMTAANASASSGFWAFYATASGDHPSIAPAGGLCRGLLVPAGLFVMLGITAPLLRQRAG